MGHEKRPNKAADKNSTNERKEKVIQVKRTHDGSSSSTLASLLTGLAIGDWLDELARPETAPSVDDNGALAAAVG